MTRLRVLVFTAAIAICGSPLAALAAPTGSVTTGPLANAPTLALPLLVLLAVILAGLTMFRLRRSATTLAILAGLAVAASLLSIGIIYATPTTTITISGGACNGTVTNPYDPTSKTFLTNGCITPIKIIDVTVDCNNVNATASG